jgi:Fe2+ transport system protein FeoA
LGLVLEVEVLMVSNRGRGPAIVEVKGARLALGRGMAAKMLVQPA